MKRTQSPRAQPSSISRRPIRPDAAGVRRGRYRPFGSDSLTETVARALRTLYEKELQEDWPGLAACYLTLGDTYRRVGEEDLAQEMYRNALWMLRLVRRGARPSTAPS